MYLVSRVTWLTGSSPEAEIHYNLFKFVLRESLNMNILLDLYSDAPGAKGNLIFYKILFNVK